MHLETAAAGKTFATNIAFVRFDAVMRTHMSGQMTRTDESTMANLANVRLLTGVRSQMYDGRFVSGEFLITISVRASIRTFPSI